MTAREESLDRVRKALRHVLHGLSPHVEARMKACYHAQWQAHITRAAGGDQHGAFDEYALLKTMIDNWQPVFADGFASAAERNWARNFVSTAFDARNAVAHAAAEIDDAAALNYLYACHQLLRVMKARASEAAEAKRLYEAQRHTGVHLYEPEPTPPPSPAPTTPVPRGIRAGTVGDVLLDYVRRNPGLDDDELARNLGKRREHINQVAHRLEDQGLIRRDHGPRGKIVNRAKEGSR